MLKKYGIEFLVAIVSVFTPVKPMVETIICLILADVVFGIWAAIKRGEKFNSAALSHSVIKMLVYLSTVRIAYSVQMNLLDNLFPVCSIIAGLIGCVELKSLLENAEDILGQPLFLSIINQLKQRTQDPTKDYFSSSTSTTVSSSTPISDTSTTTSTKTDSSQDKV